MSSYETEPLNCQSGCSTFCAGPVGSDGSWPICHSLAAHKASMAATTRSSFRPDLPILAALAVIARKLSGLHATSSSTSHFDLSSTRRRLMCPPERVHKSRLVCWLDCQPRLPVSYCVRYLPSLSQGRKRS